MVKAIREIKEQYIVDEKGKRVGVVLDAQVYQALIAELQSLRASTPRLRAKNSKRRTIKRAHKTAVPIAKGEPSERERVREILRKAGLVGEPTAKEKQLIAEWETVPAEERARLLAEFRTAKLTKPLSQIVIENRR